jgi:opacity protein-like surface antigen
MRSKLLAALAALTFLAPIAASAQAAPSYAQPAAAPEEQIRGRIASFDGGYSLTVNDDRGFVDTVQLHDGTIILPTGLTLAPGMVVSILGYNAGNFFAANEVDTPYTLAYGTPYYSGHPWTYWGPSISLGFFFGNTGWWHGNYYTGPYHYYGNARVYTNAQPRPPYRTYGTYNGRTYVAPPERGGYYPRSRPHATRPPGRWR